MLFWGPPSHFGSFSKKENSTILFIDDRKTADRVLLWINKHMGRSFVAVAGMTPEALVVDYGFYYIHFLLELGMERARWHLQLHVSLFTISSSVTSVANISMTCVLVFLVLSREPVITHFGCGLRITKLTRD